ncbi:MAG: cytochrome C [Deltaproteobacteria bacterium]|jgi:hypothetical protein|nr:cytochrome C [Deltaproteobacteria bacterium]MBW2266005.1 cytochrome C [Deltaproteobacteria bacterium]MBW2318719.1 cytochrome C [Deltaproteobacteria bacterium]MBW2601960.1 cytochrome C [Deltaproteobacteria bacterium]
MSTSEEKERNVAGGEQRTEGSSWRFLVPVIAFFAGFLVFLCIGWGIFPKILYSEKQQPIDFNHQLHVDEMGDCEACHYFREDGSFSGIPKSENCIECHESAMGEHPEEAKLIDQYIEPGKEIPWLSYARQPDCVFFSHAAHVRMAGLDCMTCHGPIGESEHTRPYQYNRLTKYSRDIWGWNIAGIKTNTWDRMKMDDCAECHEENGTNQACFVCHK